MIKKIFISFLVFLVCLVPTFALSIPKQDKSIYVNDYADVLSESTKKSLISINESSDHKTGGYVVVATFDFVDEDLYDYAYQIFNKWGVGDSQNNNGVLLVLDIGNENCAWIIGTGLEDSLTDSRCQSIINQYFKEDFLNKKYDTAVLNTTKQFLKYIDEGNFQVADNNQSGFFKGVDIVEIISIGVVILIIVVAVISSLFAPRRRGYSSRPRRYHRAPPPPPPHHGPHHRGSPGPRGGPAPRPSPRGPRPSGGSMGSRPRSSGSGGGSHHSGGSSRGAGGTLK